MGDVMLFGVLRMPYDMAMADEFTRYQYHQRGLQAADAIEALQAQLAEARDKALPALDMAAESLEWAIREMDEYASILSRERCTASRAAETTVEEVRDAIRALKGELG